MKYGQFHKKQQKPLEAGVLLTLVNTDSAARREENYPFGVFRFPSLGMIACPPDVPAEIFGSQLCYAMANDFPFLGWGNPGIAVKSAVIDFTGSAGPISRIMDTMRIYYEDEVKKNMKAVQRAAGHPVSVPEHVETEAPLLFSFDTSDLPARHSAPEALALAGYIRETLIDKYGVGFIYLHGVSGFYDDAFYQCAALLKSLAMTGRTCVIMNHVISSVVYDPESQDAMRGALSHSMIRKSHEEACALMDWTWFVAPGTQGVIRNIANTDIKLPPENSAFYINKISQPNKFLSGDMAQKTGQKGPNSGLFYLYKPMAPILFEIQFEGKR